MLPIVMSRPCQVVRRAGTIRHTFSPVCAVARHAFESGPFTQAARTTVAENSGEQSDDGVGGPDKETAVSRGQIALLCRDLI